MITYSINWMGPIALSWYRERGLLEEGSVHPTTLYSAGRIDIRGLDETEYWNGCHEYGVDAMQSEDWGALSVWLSSLKTKELLPYDVLIEQFEEYYGKKIRCWQREKQEDKMLTETKKGR